MKAIVKQSNVPYELSVKEINEEKVSDHELRIQIRAAGICGSDLHMYAGHGGYDWIDYPVVFGHEMAGVVAEAGPGADRSLIGKRVVVNPYIPCGRCMFCRSGKQNLCDNGSFFTDKKAPLSLQYGFRRNGGMSEYLVVPEQNIEVLDDQITDEVGAILEAISVGVTAVEKISRVEDKMIAIVGPGPIGLSIASILSGLHAKKIVVAGIPGDEERLKRAKELGADETVVLGIQAADDLIRKSQGGYDAVFDSSGHPSVPDTALKILKKGGELTLVGISDRPFSLPMDQFVRGEIRVTGSYGITNRSFRKTIAYAAKPEFHFERLIAKSFPFQEAKEAFQSALNRSSGKVVIKFD